MWRNIFGHAFYQIVILMSILFWGKDLLGLTYENTDPFFIDENYLDLNPDSTAVLGSASDKCVIYTMVFQTFVLMQAFNLINGRKLGDRDFNIFAGFFQNTYFLMIFALILAVQYASDKPA